MVKIRLTEAQFKDYMRIKLQEEKNINYAKEIINETIKEKSKKS